MGLIHCENKLTLIQRKICNILLFNALDKINDQDIFEISLRQLCSLVGYNSHDINLIKESIKSLISVVMEWNLLEDSKFLHDSPLAEEVISWNASSLLAGASIKNGLIRYSYSPQMKSVLSSLDIYGRINLFVQAKFNSTYSLVLYENCVRFKNIKQTSWFPVELFRSLMGVTHTKYPSFKEFKRNVITVAVNEINLKSDIYIEPQYRKAGRNIVAIQFLLFDNENYHPTFKRINRVQENAVGISQDTSLMHWLTGECQLTKKQAEEIIATYDTTYLSEKINLVRAKSHVDHLGAYLIAALRKDYKTAVKQSKTLETQTVGNVYQRQTTEASEIASLKNKYMTYKLNHHVQFIQQQTAALQATIKKQFEQYLQPNLEVYKIYKKKGLSSPFVMIDFMLFIEKNFPHIIGEYLSFDDYLISDEG